MLIRPETIIEFQRAVEEAVGHDACAKMMMAGGIAGGSRSSQRYRALSGGGGEDIVRFMCWIGGELGWGDFHLKALDDESGKLIVEVADSAFAEAYGRSERSVCHLIRGVLAGLGKQVFGGDVRATEEACLAKGDARCRFEIALFHRDESKSNES